MTEQKLYGYLLEFRRVADLATGAERLRNQGYTRLEAFTPFPVPELDDILVPSRDPIPFIMLIAGVIGGLGGYGIQYYTAVIDYPILSGGKPMHSWPAFIPVTFELTILFAAFAGFLACWWSSRLPQLNHPLFDATDFDLASRDRFFLLLRTDDKDFDQHRSMDDMKNVSPVHIHPVPKQEA